MALATEQCEILAELLDPEREIPERTTAVIARRLNMSPRQVASRLAELEARSPPLVRQVLDEDWHVHAWRATPDARAAVERWCRGGLAND